MRVSIGNIVKVSAQVLLIAYIGLVVLSFFNIGGIGVYAVKSGSMEPAIGTGSLVITQPKERYSVGDVITFKAHNSSAIVTHRVVAVQTDINEALFYKVKGDANASADSGLVSQQAVIGSARTSLNYLGFAVGMARSLPGLILLIFIPAGYFISQHIKIIHQEVKNRGNQKDAKKDSPQKNKPKAGGLAVLLIISVILLPVSISQYYDQIKIDDNYLQAADEFAD